MVPEALGCSQKLVLEGECSSQGAGLISAAGAEPTGNDEMGWDSAGRSDVPRVARRQVPGLRLSRQLGSGSQHWTEKRECAI